VVAMDLDVVMEVDVNVDVDKELVRLTNSGLAYKVSAMPSKLS
jgi:hypothetical protein